MVTRVEGRARGTGRTRSPLCRMRAFAVTLVLGLLAVVTNAHRHNRASTGKVAGLRWQPSHTLGHQRRLLQQNTTSSFTTANNITSTIVNATRDGGFLLVSVAVPDEKSTYN